MPLFYEFPRPFPSHHLIFVSSISSKKIIKLTNSFMEELIEVYTFLIDLKHE